MIVVIDNYDSFTYNLVHYIGEFESDIKIFRNDELSVSEVLDMDPDKIIISPGPCTPKEAGISEELIRLSNVPLLGVCLGHQAIGSAFGGRIIKASDINHGKSSKIMHPPPSPKTNPSLSLSKGREALSGSWFLVDKACIALNPPIPAHVTAASEPPANITSA